MPLGWLFGKKADSKAGTPPPPPPSTKPSAGLAEKLEGYQEKAELWTRKAAVIQAKIATLRAEALAAKQAKNDRLALMKLKEMKLQEKNYEDTLAKVTNLQTLVEALQTADEQREYADMLASLKTDLKQQHQNIEEVEKVQDDLEDIIQTQKELAETLHRPLADPMTDFDAEAEFEKMMAEDDAEKAEADLEGLDKAAAAAAKDDSALMDELDKLLAA